MINIEEKTAIVTGANRGIGKAIVETLLKQNIKKVYACARNPDSMSWTEDSRVEKIALDITNQDQLAHLKDVATDANLLINNAGVNTVGSLLESDWDTIPYDLNINFLGTLKVIRELYPILEKNGSGIIVNIISICGLAAMPSLGGYSVSKAALFSATQALRTELKAKGIQLTGIHPGPVDTDMNEGLEIEMAKPEDIANEIIQGFVRGDEDVYPDPMARDVYEKWHNDPKSLEVDFRQY